MNVEQLIKKLSDSINDLQQLNPERKVLMEGDYVEDLFVHVDVMDDSEEDVHVTVTIFHQD